MAMRQFTIRHLGYFYAHNFISLSSLAIQRCDADVSNPVLFYQWWRRLVNAYEVKAGMVCLQCKNCVIRA